MAIGTPLTAGDRAKIRTILHLYDSLERHATQVRSSDTTRHGERVFQILTEEAAAINWLLLHADPQGKAQAEVELVREAAP